MISTPAPFRSSSSTIEAVAVNREGIYRTQCGGIPKPCSICGWELARVVCAKIYGPHRPFSSDKWVATEETWILLWEIITTAGNLDSFIKTTRLTDTNIFELLLLNMNQFGPGKSRTFGRQLLPHYIYAEANDFPKVRKAMLGITCRVGDVPRTCCETESLPLHPIHGSPTPAPHLPFSWPGPRDAVGG